MRLSVTDDFAPRYIEDEIAALRAEFEAVDGLRANGEAANKTGFVVSKCEAKGAIFIQFRGGSASPVALAEGVSAAAQQGIIFPKFVKRLMPCTKTCFAAMGVRSATARFSARDLWTHTSNGTVTVEAGLTVTVAPSAAVMYKLTPV